MRAIRSRAVRLAVALLAALIAEACDQDREFLDDHTDHCSLYTGGVFTLDFEGMDAREIMEGDREFFEFMRVAFATFDLAPFPAWMAPPEELFAEDGGADLTFPFIDGYVHMIAYTDCRAGRFKTDVSTEDLQEGLAFDLGPVSLDCVLDVADINCAVVPIGTDNVDIECQILLGGADGAACPQGVDFPGPGMLIDFSGILID